MKVHEIRVMPTVVKSVPAGSNGVHESVLRSYQILRKVQRWLTLGVHSEVILELIDEMDAPTNASFPSAPPAGEPGTLTK